MLTLPEAIKTLRRRQQMTMAQFAELLGCTQPTVSRYEKGILIPSRSVLLLLSSLSEGEVRDTVLAELNKSADGTAQATADTLLDSFAKFQNYLKHDPGLSESNEPPEVTFAREAAEALTATPRPTRALVGILQLWNDLREFPEAQRFFEDARVYLAVETATLRHRPDKNAY